MRALQGSTDPDPDLAMHEAFVDDRYLLCSDGLTDVVADEAVYEILTTSADADEAVQQALLTVYRTLPFQAQVCERLVDLDEGLQEMRQAERN